MSVLKKLAGETAIYGMSSILGRMLGFLLLPFHTAVLTAGQYGIMSYLYTISSVLTVFLIFRMETAFFRFGTEADQRNKAYTTSLGWIVASTLTIVTVLCVAAAPLSEWIGYAGHANYVIWIACILGLDVLAEIPLARLRLEHKARWFATIRIINIIVYIFGNIFFLWFCPLFIQQKGILGDIISWCYRPDWNVEYIIIANLIASAVTLLLLLPGSLRLPTSETQPQPETWRFDPQLWRTMMRYAAPLVVVGIAGMINETMSRYFLMHWLPGTQAANEAQVGIFSGCYKLAMLVSLFTQAFRYAAEPFFFAQAAQKDAPDLYARVSRYFTLAGAIAFAAVMLGMPILRYIVNQNYWQGLSVVPILLLANIMLGQYYNFSVWYRIKDKTAIGMWIAIAGAAITVLLNWLVIPHYGYYGSALVTLTCYTFMAVATWSLGQRYFPVPYQLTTMFGYIGTAIGTYILSQVLTQALHLAWLPWLCLNSILMLLFLMAVLWLFDRDIWNTLRQKIGI